MENKVQILQIMVFISFVGCDTTTSFDFNLNSEVSMETEFFLNMPVEVKQSLGIDCREYTNIIKNFWINYKMKLIDMNLGCKLHVQSATEELKSMIDDIVDLTLDKYLQNIKDKKLKIDQMKKYSYLQSVKKLNEKYQEELGEIQKNVSNLIKENDNLNELTGKCQNNLKEVKANLEVTIHDKKRILIKSQIVSLIRTGNFEFGREFFLFLNEFDRDLLIASIYNHNISNAEIVIEFLDSFSDDEEIILGYRLLFDQMIKNQQVHSTPTTTIAYRAFHDFIEYKDNKNLIYLKEKLPQSLNSLEWHNFNTAENVKFNQTICIKDDEYHRYDNLRLTSFVSNKCSYRYNWLSFDPISNGKYFHIYVSEYMDMYLYAETDEYALGSSRAVFWWGEEEEVKETGKWQLEPIEGSQSFKIKNFKWNEYLSVAEELRVPGYATLTTLRSGKCEDDNCKWNILKI